MERFLGYGRKFLSAFAAIFTGVILASAVFIGIYSHPTLPLSTIVQALAVAAVSALLTFVYCSEKPIRKRGLALRTGIHFIVQFSLVMLLAWRFQWISFDYAPSVLTFVLLFLAVYAAIWIANFAGDLLDERKINRRLAERNRAT